MGKLVSKIQGLCGKERGASAVEYGLLIALVAAVIVGAIVFSGSANKNVKNNATNTIEQKK